MDSLALVTTDEELAQNVGTGNQIENSGTTNIIDNRTIIYRNEAMEWNLEDHYFGIIFQPDSLPADISDTTVEISVTSANDYVLPKETVPASAFFSIKCQHKFCKPVLVYIEHSSAEKSDLSFVVSSNSESPFQLLNGGKFVKRYGLIERNEFCCLGIVNFIQRCLQPEKNYYIALYTSLPVNYNWKIFIYIMEDSHSSRCHIEEDAKDSNLIRNTYTVATVTHTVDYFTMDITMNNDEISRGWQIPLDSKNPIKKSRKEIDKCQKVKKCPIDKCPKVKCREVPTPIQFEITLDVSKTSTLSHLVHKYEINDVDQDSNLRLRLIPPQTSTDGGSILRCNEEEDFTTTDSDQYFPDEKIAYEASEDPCHPLKLKRGREYPDGQGVKIAIIDNYEIQTSKMYHKALLNNGKLKITLVDAYTQSDKVQEIHANEHQNVVISNHALQCTAIAVGEKVEGTFIYKNKNKAYTYPGGVAPKALATLYLVDNYSKNSVALALKDVIKKNFHVLSMSFGSLKKCKHEDELKNILQDTSTIVVVAAGNRGNAVISCTAKLLDKPEFCGRNLISVGGINCCNKIAKYSPTNEKYVTTYQICEFFAPFSDDSPTSLRFTAGTSMSTPAVAGIICLLIQIGKKHGIDTLSKSEIICLLKNAIKDETVTIEGGCYYQEFLKKALKDQQFFEEAKKEKS